MLYIAVYNMLPLHKLRAGGWIAARIGMNSGPVSKKLCMGETCFDNDTLTPLYPVYFITILNYLKCIAVYNDLTKALGVIPNCFLKIFAK